ncbi:MAG: hypothetical protein JWO59_3074, partial [Chloroflexi bacterium]|nr:hypothetical protein [Chloroflexota bacterium]
RINHAGERTTSDRYLTPSVRSAPETLVQTPARHLSSTGASGPASPGWNAVQRTVGSEPGAAAPGSLVAGVQRRSGQDRAAWASATSTGVFGLPDTRYTRPLSLASPVVGTSHSDFPEELPAWATPGGATLPPRLVSDFLPRTSQSESASVTSKSLSGGSVTGGPGGRSVLISRRFLPANVPGMPAEQFKMPSAQLSRAGNLKLAALRASTQLQSSAPSLRAASGAVPIQTNAGRRDNLDHPGVIQTRSSANSLPATGFPNVAGMFNGTTIGAVRLPQLMRSVPRAASGPVALAKQRTSPVPSALAGRGELGQELGLRREQALYYPVVAATTSVATQEGPMGVAASSPAAVPGSRMRPSVALPASFILRSVDLSGAAGTPAQVPGPSGTAAGVATGITALPVHHMQARALAGGANGTTVAAIQRWSGAQASPARAVRARAPFGTSRSVVLPLGYQGLGLPANRATSIARSFPLVAPRIAVPSVAQPETSANGDSNAATPPGVIMRRSANALTTSAVRIPSMPTRSGRTPLPRRTTVTGWPSAVPVSSALDLASTSVLPASAAAALMRQPTADGETQPAFALAVAPTPFGETLISRAVALPRDDTAHTRFTWASNSSAMTQRTSVILAPPARTTPGELFGHHAGDRSLSGGSPAVAIPAGAVQRREPGAVQVPGMQTDIYPSQIATNAGDTSLSSTPDIDDLAERVIERLKHQLILDHERSGGFLSDLMR